MKNKYFIFFTLSKLNIILIINMKISKPSNRKFVNQKSNVVNGKFNISSTHGFQSVVIDTNAPVSNNESFDDVDDVEYVVDEKTGEIREIVKQKKTVRQQTFPKIDSNKIAYSRMAKVSIDSFY